MNTTIVGQEASMDTRVEQTFLGVYHNIRYYTSGGKIHCLFGWMPKTFDSVKQFQHAVRKWENEDD
jgi:hypothetical protein